MALPTNQPIFHMNHSKLDCLNSGLALILILLLFTVLGDHHFLALPTLLVTLLVMIKPTIFQAFACIWLGFSTVMGTFMSKVILSIIFLVVVTPIALIRASSGADAMQKKKWRQETGSVFRVRDKTLGPRDLENMF